MRFQRVDGWVNTVLGLGQAATDRRMSGYHAEGADVALSEYSSLFYEDGLVRRIVQAEPFAALRQGFELVADVELDSEARVQAEERIWERWGELGAADALFNAACWGRLHGRGGVLVGTEEDDLSQPLDVDRAHTLRFLRDYDAESLMPSTKYTDHLTPEYGQVERYTVQPGDGVGKTFTCHASRLLCFGGVLTSRRERAKLGFRDHSILRAVYQDVQDYATVWGSVNNMLIDASMPILTVKDLWAVFAGKFKEQFQERLEVINLARWAARVMPLDTEETYTYAERTFTGIPEMLDRIMYRVCAITGIPATVLFGRSPAGLNATGESDMRLWYDTVQDQRDRTYTRPIETIVRMIALEQGLPDAWGIRWPSLWQETPKERAERMGLTATMDATYLGAGVLTPDEVAMARFGSGEWSDAAPALDMDARSLQVQVRDLAQAEIEARSDAWRQDPDMGPPPEGKAGETLVQSVVFPESWTKERMRRWLEEHDYKTRGIEDNRARQYNPEYFQDLTSDKLPNGVTFVRGTVK